MQQALYAGSRMFEVREVSRPAIAAGHVLIDVAYTGLCGTDLHIYHGDMDARVSMPAVIGHEMSGEIAEYAADVDGWDVGDRVTVMPLRWCGHCPACRQQTSYICHNLDFLGIDSAGSLQQLWSVPASALVRLAPQMSLRDGALVEPTAVAVHDVRRAQVTPGEKVVVIGGGPVGLLIAVVTQSVGADVTVVEPDAYRRTVAEQVGLATLDARDPDLVELLQSWTDGAGASVAFEVSGSAHGVNTAVDVLATHGRICLVAIHPAPRPVNLHRFFWRELTLIGARLYERADFERAVELIASGRIPVAAMISRVVALTGLTDAFAALDAGSGLMKVLVDCSGRQS